MRLWTAAVAALMLAGGAQADVGSPAIRPAAALLTPGDQLTYRDVFAAIRAGDWARAEAGLAALPGGLLTPLARNEMALAKGSPKLEGAALAALVATAPELPQAPALARLARTRGGDVVASLPAQRDLVRANGAPRRGAARATRSDAALARAVAPLIKADQPSAAETLVEERSADLSAEALSEWRHRIAWAYYQLGDDVAARRVATMARGGAGEWTVQAAWVQGLAAYRAGDYPAAADAFQAVAAGGRDSETIAAGLFWAARSALAGGMPDRVQARLRSASRLGETFYGMLAEAALGVAPADQRLAGPAALDGPVAERPNIRLARALVELGERGLADQLVRHQARIGAAGDHDALLRVAAALDLPATQIWLAQNCPSGHQSSVAARYPSPGWTPAGGWRVDKALIFAHALQESQFRTDARSPAGARGLMQLMPGTAALVARTRGDAAVMPSQFDDPAFSIAYGQAYLERLANGGATGGLLPKVIAAYNAGPGSVDKWNAKGRNLADPLLFIESIPFAETRGYVAIVLRNYWMYQRQAGAASASMRAIAQGQWPRFPGLPGKTALRMNASGVVMRE